MILQEDHNQEKGITPSAKDHASARTICQLAFWWNAASAHNVKAPLCLVVFRKKVNKCIQLGFFEGEFQWLFECSNCPLVPSIPVRYVVPKGRYGMEFCRDCQRPRSPFPPVLEIQVAGQKSFIFCGLPVICGTLGNNLG